MLRRLLTGVATDAHRAVFYLLSVRSVIKAIDFLVLQIDIDHESGGNLFCHTSYVTVLKNRLFLGMAIRAG